MKFFDGFSSGIIDVPSGRIHVRYGGQGRPVLLLHGHPRTHATWHRLAPLLADSFAVVCPDLPGFGRSYIPSDTPDHIHSSKRAKASAMIELMRALGHERFAVVGHDRGAYTAFRMALDHPDSIERLAVLDAVPIIEALERCDARFAGLWWHWFFFAQPEKPERAILADPLRWYSADPARMGGENYRDFCRAIHDPDVVHGMMEDYRAGLGIDREHDAADRDVGRKVRCPTLCLWAQDDDLPILYGDVLGVWRPWTTDLRGHMIKAGHHLAEDASGPLAAALQPFLCEGDASA